MRRTPSAYEVRRTRWEQRVEAGYDSSRLFLTIGQPGEKPLRDFSLAVTTLQGLTHLAGKLVVTDRAHIVIPELDHERVRQYVTRTVQNCPAIPPSEAEAMFERYFDPVGFEPVREARRRRSGVAVRGFDPPWCRSDNDVTITFGVAERTSGADTELTVNAVTPSGLAARAVAGDFVLCHRATILVGEMDVPGIHAHIVDRVAGCSGGDLAVALPSLQRYYRLSWETSLSRGHGCWSAGDRTLDGPSAITWDEDAEPR